MKKSLPVIVMLSLLAMAMPARAEGISLSTKVPVSFYGFITAQTLVTDSQLSSFGGTTMNAYNRVVDETISSKNNGSINFTVQNTRFGFNLDPYDFDGKPLKAEARIEMDFMSVANTNATSMNPRIRRAYAAIGRNEWKFLFGQEWDLFSPLNPATLNLGASLWQTGNEGFRHPQIRFTYAHALVDKSGIEAATSLNLPSNSLDFNDASNETGMPMLEGRVGYFRDLSAGKMQAYLSGAFSRSDDAANAGASKVKNWGLALSLDVPIHKYFKPAAEIHYGYSMNSMFSISAATTRQRTIAGWGQVVSTLTDWLDVSAGLGAEFLKDSEVAAGSIKRNMAVFANLKFKPLPPFVIGFEYSRLRTNYQGNGSSCANVGLMNVMYTF